MTTGLYSKNIALAARSHLERVTGIEPALSAWESGPFRALMWPELRSWLSASDREIPVFTGVNGTLMARRSWTAPWLMAPRPSAFQTGHIPSWRGSCQRYALSLVADVSGWLLLSLSPLLSAADPVPHLRGLSGAVAAPCLAQTPPPNPIAAEPDGGRVLSRGGAADHAVTPQAPLTGSGCREHSYGGFGGGHPHFHPNVSDLLIRRSGRTVQGCPVVAVCWPDVLWPSFWSVAGYGLGYSLGYSREAACSPGARTVTALAARGGVGPIVQAGATRLTGPPWTAPHGSELQP
jgi:hypothetical protein